MSDLDADDLLKRLSEAILQINARDIRIEQQNRVIAAYQSSGACDADAMAIRFLEEREKLDQIWEILKMTTSKCVDTKKRLGPLPDDPVAQMKKVDEFVSEATRKLALPVNRAERVLASGAPVPEDGSHLELLPLGQQRDYVVLSDAERGRGFVRPYRDAYRHLKCGKITTMARPIAETYARDPGFYTGTFCTTCCAHFPVGEDGEFVWYEMNGTKGPKVGL